VKSHDRKRGTLRFLTATIVCCFYLGAPASRSLFAASSESEADLRLDIVDKYVDATHVQEESLRGFQMEVNIDAKLPKLEKHGKLLALRKISRLGLITYKALGFSGDNTVKREVITRYLAAESAGRENGTIAITPANYKFRYAGRLLQRGATIQILDITPRKKAVGLFKGQIWIDSDSGMPIRESGQFVKTPSVFLKKIAFVRDYEIRGGVAYPSHIQSTVDTRIVGRAQLDISFSNFSKEDSDDEADTELNSEAGSAEGARPPSSISSSPATTGQPAPSVANAPVIASLPAPPISSGPSTTGQPAPALLSTPSSAPAQPDQRDLSQPEPAGARETTVAPGTAKEPE
jgi:hypothetical protein